MRLKNNSHIRLSERLIAANLIIGDVRDLLSDITAELKSKKDINAIYEQMDDLDTAIRYIAKVAQRLDP